MENIFKFLWHHWFYNFFKRIATIGKMSINQWASFLLYIKLWWTICENILQKWGCILCRRCIYIYVLKVPTSLKRLSSNWKYFHNNSEQCKVVRLILQICHSSDSHTSRVPVVFLLPSPCQQRHWLQQSHVHVENILGRKTPWQHLLYMYSGCAQEKYGAGSVTKPAPYAAGAGCVIQLTTPWSGWDQR